PTPALLYLAAAGVGTIGIVDDDVVSLSNLQRQILHNTGTVGAEKVASAAAALEKLNPFVKVEQHAARLDAGNALEMIGGYDLVAEGTDNFATRYLLNDACYLARKPLVSAAVGQFDGSVTTFRAFEPDKDGNPNPTYRCLFPAAPPRDMAPACEEAGILGVVPGIIGSIQAMEVIKEILGIGTSLVGRMLTYDARDARMLDVRYKWDPKNPLNGTEPTIFDLSGHEAG
ncbi:MAG: ThiF family adenylyltransferase, partial [Fimbriimonadaceae bacterium]|nr:ThiF family adenylyltransferase [Alphaproteobacteria bacterium]